MSIGYVVGRFDLIFQNNDSTVNVCNAKNINMRALKSFKNSSK